MAYYYFALIIFHFPFVGILFLLKNYFKHPSKFCNHEKVKTPSSNV